MGVGTPVKTDVGARSPIRELDIEVLAPEQNSCTRCRGTPENREEAIETVQHVTASPASALRVSEPAAFEEVPEYLSRVVAGKSAKESTTSCCGREINVRDGASMIATVLQEVRYGWA